MVDANVFAIHRGAGKSMNIGSGETTTINRIFELLQDISGYKWDPLRAPSRVGEGYRISVDSSRAYQELGWLPKIELEEGLKITVDYFKESSGSHSGH